VPHVHLDDSVLEVHLSRWEKVAGLLRDLRVPLDAVIDVEVVPDGLAAAAGLRAPGLALPGVTRYGTWRRRGSKHFVAVRRGMPALRLTLRGQRFADALVSLPDAEDVADRLGSRP
jgi:hypothetical protein